MIRPARHGAPLSRRYGHFRHRSTGRLPARLERRLLRRVRVAARMVWHAYLHHIDRHVDRVTKGAIVVAFGAIIVIIFAEIARRCAS